MNCKHTALRCTNNRFFCLTCGAEVPAPKVDGSTVPEKPKPAPKRARKTKAD